MHDGDARQIWSAEAPWTTSSAPLVYWCAHGTAEVETAGSQQLPLQAGEAAVVRPGVRYRLRTGRGGVAVPILLETAGADRCPEAAATAIAVPEAWSAWLVHAFVRNLGYLQGEHADGALLDLLGSAGRRPEAASPLPPLPRSPAAFTVAHRMLSAPADATRPADLAAAVGLSERTLQRHFTTETGLSPQDWRSRARLATACEHLTAGHDIGWVADQVGFATASGFTRAFRTVLGCTPSEYRRRARTTGEIAAPTQAPPSGTAVPWRDEPPSIPASRTWPRVNGAHVAVWVYRGRAQVGIGEREWSLTQGEAIVLPAGLRNQVEVAAGSLLLPLGFRPPAEVPVVLGDLRPCRFEADGEPWLLQQVVARYTPLSPAGHDPCAAFDAVVAAATGAAPGRSRGIGSSADVEQRFDDLAAALGVSPAELRGRFRELTGTTLAGWHALLRMTQAREQLTLGVPASTVARTLGYAHLPAFSRAFKSVHGLSPRQFLRSSAARAAAAEWRATG